MVDRAKMSALAVIIFSAHDPGPDSKHPRRVSKHVILDAVIKQKHTNKSRSITTPDQINITEEHGSQLCMCSIKNYLWAKASNLPLEPATFITSWPNLLALFIINDYYWA